MRLSAWYINIVQGINGVKGLLFSTGGFGHDVLGILVQGMIFGA